MNGIDKITARLENEARTEIDAVTAQAAEQCAQIKSEYEKKAQDEYAKRLQAGAKACESRVSRLGSAADMEAKKSILGFKQEMVSNAFELAMQKLVSMPEDKYVAFLSGQAAKAASTGSEQLAFNSKDKSAVGAKVAQSANALLEKNGLPGKLTVAEKTRDIPGGLVVCQGDIEVNCSVDTLVQLYRNELASQVAEILFS